uniref:SLC26A/SulP transporter domain-containing protein n=1 Tax=Timema bartmani TaxID=61472 RepID=A0A7R9EUL2_9NEOP|nr:unnamed protein product [Timema bartmani]
MKIILEQLSRSRAKFSQVTQYCLGGLILFCRVEYTRSLGCKDFLRTPIPASAQDSEYRPWCCSVPGTTMSSCRWRPGTLRKAVRRNIPILTWLPKYNLDTFVSDLIAGVTVGLTVMPQGLAYATLAGLEPQYGLYSAFMGCFVYLILGSCKDITIGPTALMALMTYQQVVGRNPDFAILLCFLSGCVQLLMSVLHLGVLVDFISIPVTVGFTSATSVIIAVSQLKGLLGLSFTSSGFVDNVKKVYQQIGETRLGDTVLGGVCIVILLLLRKLKDVKLGPKDDKPSERQRVLMKIFWLVSTSRNALVVIVCSVLAFMFHTSEKGLPFLLTGTVRSGLPPFGLPPFSTVIGNQSYSFMDMCSELGSSIVLVPIIAVLGNVAIAKAFASGHSVNATQELLTLGLCNILGSFASSMPVTGSFSRSAVNHASGVKTPLGGLYTGVLILLALSLLTPYFYFIPKASLAAVIICAVIFMIEYEVVQPMWKSSRVGINIVFLLYPSARPAIHVERKTVSIKNHDFYFYTLRYLNFDGSILCLQPLKNFTLGGHVWQNYIFLIFIPFSLFDSSLVFNDDMFRCYIILSKPKLIINDFDIAIRKTQRGLEIPKENNQHFELEFVLEL